MAVWIIFIIVNSHSLTGGDLFVSSGLCICCVYLYVLGHKWLHRHTSCLLSNVRPVLHIWVYVCGEGVCGVWCVGGRCVWVEECVVCRWRVCGEGVCGWRSVWCVGGGCVWVESMCGWRSVWWESVWVEGVCGEGVCGRWVEALQNTILIAGYVLMLK